MNPGVDNSDQKLVSTSLESSRVGNYKGEFLAYDVLFVQKVKRNTEMRSTVITILI